MALVGKIEKDVEIKTSADQFYKVLGTQAHHVPNASDIVHGVEVHEGDWETAGSIMQWSYTIGGKREIFKEKLHLDDQSKTVVFTAVAGDALELYKDYKITFQVLPAGEAGVVKITIEYEKLNADVPTPTHYLDALVNLMKDIDAHIVKGLPLPA